VVGRTTTVRPPTFLEQLSANDADDLLSLGADHRIARGKAVMWEGEASTAVFVVLEGWVKIVAGGSRPTILNLCRAGDVLGEIGFVDGMPRTADVVALTEVRAQVFDAATFQAFVASHAEVSAALSQVLSSRLRRSSFDTQALATESVFERLAHRLAKLAEDHGEPTTNGALTIDAGLSQDDFASWIGASREATARALQRLRRQGLIDTARRSITVVDIDRLRDIVT
jgi:CRP/FNR family transcriptional regulator, cyclic AMP receptor protein